MRLLRRVGAGACIDRLYGCIDIGSNTTRLLVAEVEEGRLREVQARRVFTQIGASLGPDGHIPGPKVEETARVTAELVEEARRLGVDSLTVLGTAAVREAANGAELQAALRERAGVDLRVIDGKEEAALSFAGACHALEASDGRLAVVDVGGGSTEIAVGRARRAPEWWRSVPLGSSLLCRRHLRSDPPAEHELAAARAEADAVLAELAPPHVDEAVAVGGTATALSQLVAGPLTRDTLSTGLGRLCAQPAASAARDLGLEPERVRLLPGGMTVLAAVSGLLGTALRVVRSGLREGALLELSRPAGPAQPGAGAA
jgi:exopolyphosphatase / guanosine-5'-triphosphate,3'-diphosphate pyrophosphatase